MKNRVRYNKQLFPRYNYKILSPNDIKNYILLREERNDEYPDFCSYKLQNKGVHQNHKSHSKAFINDNKNAFEKIFSSQQLCDGLSVNLYSVYRKRDSLIFPIREPYLPDVHEYWIQGDRHRHPTKFKIYKRNVSVGIKCSLIPQIETYKEYTSKNNKIPSEWLIVNLFLKHAPTYCNFWHCEIHMSYTTEDGTVFRGKEEISAYLVAKFGDTQKYINKKLGNMAKELRTKLLEKLFIRPKCRGAYLPKRVYQN